MSDDPFSDAPLSEKPETFAAALTANGKHPWISVTQGGSSRKFSGARVAARDANVVRHPPKKKD